MTSLRGFCLTLIDQAERVAAVLHAIEGISEREVFAAYGIEGDDLAAVLDETGTPAGWFPLIEGFDETPSLPEGLAVPAEVLSALDRERRRHLSAAELEALKKRLSTMYVAGPGAQEEDAQVEDEPAGDDDEDEEAGPVSGARIPIPAETFIEEIAQKIEVHPVSVYRLLRDLRQHDGLVCPPELKRFVEDYFSVNLLLMLGHRWPEEAKSEGAKRGPDVDADGIVPLTAGAGEETVLDRFHRFLDEEFGAEHGATAEQEAGQILGWKPGDEWGTQKAVPMGRWLERDFFKRHVSQFKKRPIAWHLTSDKGTFQALVYYHTFDKNHLTLLRARYVRQVLESLSKQLGEAKKAGQDKTALATLEELETKVADVRDFDDRLRRLLEGKDRDTRIWCPWKKAEEQPVGWDPDVNDGVRVNIAPVQRLGLLAADVLSAKDVKSLLAPEGRG